MNRSLAGAGVFRATGALLACLTLVACATVPVVDERPVGAAAAGAIRLQGARGPLSRRQSTAILNRLAARSPDAGALERHLAVEQAVAESPLFAGNHVTILRDGVQTFPAMFAAIHGAQRSLRLEYYIFEDVVYNDEHLGDLLVSKAQSGVQVAIIYDGIGSIGTPAAFFERLQDAGAKVVQFNPPNPLTAGGRFSINDRDHRKMLIADDSLVIVGGVNLSSTYQSAPGSSRDETSAANGSAPAVNTTAATLAAADAHGKTAPAAELRRGGAPAPPAVRSGASAASGNRTTARDPAAPATTASGPSIAGAVPWGAQTTEDRTAAAKGREVWHDTDLQISGPVVAELTRLFKDHWREQKGPALEEEGAAAPAEQLPAPAASAATDTAPAESGTEIVRIVGSAPRHFTSRYYVTVLTAIRNAERSIWITSAYFVPTHQEKEGLIHAARSGVDVRLLLPSHSDSSAALQVQHSHYADLLDAGVKIFERDDGILHSKTMVVDGVWSITGSSNFDHRSVLFNDEVDAVVIGKTTGEQLGAVFQSDLQHAKPVDLKTWRQRGVLTRVREQFWKLWEKLL